MGLNIALSPAPLQGVSFENANQSKNRIWVSRIDHRGVLLLRSYRRKLFAVKLKKDFAVPREVGGSKGSGAFSTKRGQTNGDKLSMKPAQARD